MCTTRQAAFDPELAVRQAGGQRAAEMRTQGRLQHNDMYFQVKSSKIAEELTATAPLQFWEAVHDVNKRPSVARTQQLANEGDCEVS